MPLHSEIIEQQFKVGVVRVRVCAASNFACVLMRSRSDSHLHLFSLLSSIYGTEDSGSRLYVPPKG